MPSPPKSTSVSILPLVLQSLLDMLTEAYTAAAEVVQYTPGEATSTVRAFASLLVNEINSTSMTSPEETTEYQARR